jgi:hypothetical protein
VNAAVWVVVGAAVMIAVIAAVIIEERSRWEPKGRRH